MQTSPSQQHLYFLNYESQHKQSPSRSSFTQKQKMKEQMNSVVDSLFKRIQKGSLIIAEESQNITLTKGKTIQPQESKEKLQSIKKQKMEIMRKLQKINQEELKIRETKQYHVSKERSELTEEDKITLKRLNKAKKLFEKDLEKKDQMVRSRLLSMKQKQQELLKSVKSKKNQVRTLEAKSKIEEIKMRSDERKIKNEESNRLIMELKNKKSLFKQMQKGWQQAQETEQQRILNLKAEIKEAKMVNFDNIRQHEKNYEQILSKQRQQRQQKIRQINQMQKKIKEWLPAESNAYKNMKFYDQNENRQSQFKNALPKINTEKRKQYSAMVKQSIFPTMKVNNSKIAEPEQQLRSLSTNELYEQGNKYMRQVKKFINKNKSKNKQGQTHSSMAPSINSTYTDYLKQQRGKNKRPKNELRELKSMIEGQQFDNSEKLEKVKHSIETLEMKNEKDQKKLIALMNMKLSMLQNLR